MMQIPSADNDYTAACNVTYSKFTGVSVDGVTTNAYTSWEGSTYVKLNADYINSLSEGSHTLTLHFTDGDASSRFTVSGSGGIQGIYVLPYGEGPAPYTPSVTPSLNVIQDDRVEEGTTETTVDDGDYESGDGEAEEASPGESGQEDVTDEPVAAPPTGDASGNSGAVLVLSALVLILGMVFVSRKCRRAK